MTQHFMQSTLQGFDSGLSPKALLPEQVAKEPGLFCGRVDPRVRLAGILMLVVSVVLCPRLEIVAALFMLAVAIAIASRVSLLSLGKRVWIVVLAFTGLIALPALFTTPGEAIVSLPATHLSITAQGLRTALLLILRVETAATLTTVLVLSTPWNHTLKALRSFHLPAEVVTMLAMTHRYVFLLLETANQMFESRQSRTVGVLTAAENRRVTAPLPEPFQQKYGTQPRGLSRQLLSRGFRGEVQLLTDFKMKMRDYAGLAAFLCVACLAAWIGR